MLSKTSELLRSVSHKCPKRSTLSLVESKMALSMATTAVLGQPSALRKASVSVRSTSRARPTITCMAKSPLALDQPKRLWETGNELWFHGLQPPEYLDGSLPGDRGFDVLGLGKVVPGPIADLPERKLEWLLEGELLNGRLAMLAVPGILVVEALGKGPWWKIPLSLDYAPLVPGPFKYVAVVIVGHLLWGALEWTRYNNFREKGSTGLVVTPFDPLGLTDDYKRQSEVRNARLAMLANLGFWSQAAATGKGPLENLKDHLEDPVHNNILNAPYPAGKYILGAFLFSSFIINLLGAAQSKPEAKLRTVFSEFK